MQVISVARWLSTLASSIAVAAAASAVAEAAKQPEADADSDRIAEIIVTAQRREENLQDVPVAITALSERQLADRGIVNIADIALVTPGVSYVEVGPGEAQLVMRGVQVSGMNATEPRFQPTVGVYFDETPVATALYNPSLNTFDVKRVEVLRGPQGTLYGSGSLSGTVKFIGNSPDPKNFDAAGRARFSNTAHSSGANAAADLMLNMPLVEDKLALRVVAGSRVDDGYVDNVANGRKDVGRYTVKSLRAALGFTPSERVSVVLKSIMQRSDADDHGSIDRLSVGIVGTPGRYQQWRLTPTPMTDQFDLLTAEINYNFDWAQLTSATSYLSRSIDNDRDGTTLAALVVPPPLQFAPLQNPLRYHGITEELRLASSGTGALRWQVGAFYSTGDKRFAQLFPVAGSDVSLATVGLPPAADFGAEPDDLFHSHLLFDEKQRALFGEISYAFLEDRLVATAGGRWFDYNLTYHVDAAGLFNGGVTSGEARPDARDFNPKFVLSYRALGNVLLAAQVAQGFRLGGPNDVIPSTCDEQLAALGLTSPPLAFGPEKARSYELDAKTSWVDDRVIFNASIYRMDYEDIQVTQPLNIPTPCGFSFTSNGGKAHTEGVELELAGRAGRQFSWSVQGTWTNAELDEDLPSGRGHKGDRLPFSAPFAGSAYGRFSFPVSTEMNGFAQVDYRYVGRRIQTLGYQGSATAAQPTPGYGLVNVSVGLNRGPLDMQLFMENVADNDSTLSGGQFDFGSRYVIINRPRTIGIEVSYRMK